MRRRAAGASDPPVQLIRCVRDASRASGERWLLTAEGKRLLHSLEGMPVAVIAIVGPYRQGQQKK